MLKSGTFDRFRQSCRAVTITDAIAAGTMIVITFSLVAGLGASVIIEDEDTGPPSANFSYDHFQDNQMLIVTHSEGDQIQASQLVLQQGETRKTWATVAEINNSSMVSPGSSVSLSANSPFGESIPTGGSVTVEWTNGNQTKTLDRWPDSEEG